MKALAMDDFIPAVRSSRRDDAKLLAIGHTGFSHHTIEQLGDVLDPSDLIVVNDAATFPSRFIGMVNGETVEVRLALHLGSTANDVRRWVAVSLQPAPSSVRTETRAPGRAMKPGESIDFGSFSATVIRVLHDNGRMFEMELCCDDLFRKLFEGGTPIQYAHLDDELGVWDQQTIFSGPAVAVEPPSSGFHFSWSLVLDLKKRGFEFVSVTHATGLSTTGDAALDSLLPLPELSVVADQAAEKINTAKVTGRRIIAIGTGATRAVEGAFHDGHVLSGSFTSLVKLGRDRCPNVIDGVLTGMHEEGTSHHELMRAFASDFMLSRAHREAVQQGYLGHEYGDLELVTRI